VNDPESATVAVLGTGVMGAGMARSLDRAGFRVVAWNRSVEKARPLAERGIRVEQDLADAVADVDVVLTMLFDTASVLEVMGEAAGSLRPDVLWVQTATVGTDGIREVAAFARQHDLELLDAPVLGTRKPAEDGQLVVLASGPPALRERAKAVLGAVGARTLVAGDEVGAASALKLVVNSWVATLTAGVAESLALAQGLRLDPQLFLDAIEGGPTDTAYAHVKGAMMIGDDFPVSFAVGGVVKDVGLIVAAAEECGVDAVLPRAVLDAFRRADEAGLADQDMAAVHRVLRADSPG
jgi:3-hydroxyisobutyrate dehydrogenase